MINTSNASNLQISGSSNEVNFNVLTNDWVNAKITGSVSVGGVYYHSWELAYPVAGSEQTLASSPTYGVGTTTRDPAVTLDNVQLAAGTFVCIRFRSVHGTYGRIYDAVTSGAGAVSTSSQVPATGILAEWRGELVSGNLKVYDFADNAYYADPLIFGTNGYRLYGSSSVVTHPPGWFLYIGSSGQTLQTNQFISGRPLTVDVVLPCTYAPGPAGQFYGYAIWNGYQIATDYMRVLYYKNLVTPNSQWVTCIRLNSTGTDTSSWSVINCGPLPYTI